MSIKVPMTKEGHSKLVEELDKLKKDRPAVVKEIEVARAHGDLSENAEYHAAKDKQGFIEAKIRMIGDKVARADVIDISKVPRDRVVFGVTVTIEDEETYEKLKYQLVGEDEADVNNGKISVTSPIARALIGKKTDDTAVVITPRGKREFTILEII